MKAPCVGWVHSPSLACREGWVGTTLRLFLNLAGNKNTGLGTLLREFAKKCTRHQLGYPAKPQSRRFLGVEPAAPGPLPPSQWAAMSFQRPGIRPEGRRWESLRGQG